MAKNTSSSIGVNKSTKLKNFKFFHRPNRFARREFFLSKLFKRQNFELQVISLRESDG